MIRFWQLLVMALAALPNNDSSTWLTYGKNHSGWRYSELSQINTGNVARLATRWAFQSDVSGKLQTTPLVFDRQMFVTAPSNHAFALDLLTGRSLWHYHKSAPRGLNLCCGQVNRGFATMGDRLFKVNIEATLVALDRKTGGVIWETKIDDFKKGYSATVAPLIVKNLVIVGIAGAEFGVRCFIDAYDADTGKRVWRFWTIPEPGEPGGDTWGRRRLMEARRRVQLDHRNLRPRAQSRLLGHRESWPGYVRGRPARRQPVQLQPGRAGRRYGKAEMALPVHSSRRP